jgi:amino acid transporter
MIERYQKQSISSAIWFAAASVTAVFCTVAAKMNTKPAIFIGIVLAIVFVTACLATVIFYCRAVLFLARAKGHSSAVFTSIFVGPFLALFLLNWMNWAIIVGVLLGPCLPLALAFLLPDKGNPNRDQDEAKYQGARCVQCNGRIPPVVKLCPHCGWTQPACDTVPAATSTAAPKTA